MKACPFCNIISGDRDRPIVYENELVIVFMPLRPSHDGHTLVMPKTHYRDLYQIPENELSQVLRTARFVAESLRILFSPPKIATYSMGLEVEHTHLHLIPVFDPYDLTTRSEFERTAKEMSITQLDCLSNTIKNALRHA